jgi:hypothetical protein
MTLSQHTMSTLWPPLVMLALLVAGALWLWWRSRQNGPEEQQASRAPLVVVHPHAAAAAEPPPPLAALVLGTSERKAYRLLRESFPRAEVLAHVQLLRFIKLPPREQRKPWMQGTGMLDVDLLLCDARFRVLAAVDVRTRRDTPAGLTRSERMVRVLEAAGITVHIWHEESLPNVAEIRRTVAPLLAERKAKIKALEALHAPLLQDLVHEGAAGLNADPSMASGRAFAVQGASVQPSTRDGTAARESADLAAYRRAVALSGSSLNR